MMKGWLLVCATCFVGGVSMAFMYTSVMKLEKPVYINQELRQQVFLECVRNSGVNCGTQAKEIATTGKYNHEVLYRPKKSDVK